jgi:hypothetical protein
MKLIIKEHGDSSVGIPEKYYEIDCPFERNEVLNADLYEFKQDIIIAFKPFAEIRMQAFYDFEMQNE